MVTSIIGTDAGKVQPFSNCGSAGDLRPAQRARLAVEVLARTEPVSQLAARCGVSRKFLYQQAHKGTEALEEAFAPAEDSDHQVLFTLPVTKDWIRQLILAQVLIGHSSFRGVIEILDALFDYRGISVGTIHNLLAQVLPRARAVNDSQELSAIRVGAHDEIYQARRPVLVGADVQSTYCYLLAAEDHCDETTWGVHLLDLSGQGLALNHSVADGGKALRAGQAAAWPTVPCHADVFHAQRDLGAVAFYLEHRAAGCAAHRQKLEDRMERAKRRGQGQHLGKPLALARQADRQARLLAQDIRSLADWMTGDILSLAGPGLSVRQELFDFVIRELAARESLCPHRIGPVRRMLEHHRDDLLAFAVLLEEEYQTLAHRFQVPLDWVRELGELEGMDPRLPGYWQRQGPLRHKLRGLFLPLQQALRQVMGEVVRASSIIENLNSRLRNYFFLRREIGNDYLDLLRFFLNHRRFLRSERPDRVGKSPAELLSGQDHSHWLELLASSGSIATDGPTRPASPPSQPGSSCRHNCYPKPPLFEPCPTQRYLTRTSPAWWSSAGSAASKSRTSATRWMPSGIPGRPAGRRRRRAVDAPPSPPCRRDRFKSGCFL